MRLEDIPVRGKRIQELCHQWSFGKVAHAYLVETPRLGENRELAKALAKAILCPVKPGYGCGQCNMCQKIDHDNHEDICFVQPEGSFLQDREVVPLMVFLKTKPVGHRNVVFIMEGDRMTLTAQNRLLKTLEEPSPGAVIFLFCERTDGLVPTIRSRCRTITMDWEALPVSEERAQARRLMDSIGRKVTYRERREILASVLEDKEEGRQRALALLDYLEEECQILLRDYTERGEPSLVLISDVVAQVESARKAIQGNIGFGYALKNLLLEMGG